MRDLLTVPYPETIEQAIAEGLRVLIDAETGRPIYACPDPDWRAHHAAWVRRIRVYPSGAPERDRILDPFPFGHVIFDAPERSGYLRPGETRPERKRRAIRSRVLADLSGWDSELRKTPEGYRRLARIVQATVRAKLSGADTGAGPFLACLLSD